MKARQLFSYGRQRDYFDHPNVIGWSREGNADHPGSGIAVLLSNGDDGWKWMEIGKAHAGEIFFDFLGNHSGEVTINTDGWGEFKTKGGSVSAWVRKS